MTIGRIISTNNQFNHIGRTSNNSFQCQFNHSGHLLRLCNSRCSSSRCKSTRDIVKHSGGRCISIWNRKRSCRCRLLRNYLLGITQLSLE